MKPIVYVVIQYVFWNIILKHLVAILSAWFHLTCGNSTLKSADI